MRELGITFALSGPNKEAGTAKSAVVKILSNEFNNNDSESKTLIGQLRKYTKFTLRSHTFLQLANCSVLDS